jgi:NAD(P)-dependent dehydrogenase (short-subunit alcohol dehydrogenase family)
MTPTGDSRAKQVALITGGNTGIGRVAARELARRGFHVFLACRSAERAQRVLDEVRAAGGDHSIEMLPLDLADFESVRTCARMFLDRGLPLHLLINNAGLAGARGLTRSGFELAFGVNHMGHFVLTQLLTERIRSSAPARIVTVASTAHYQAQGIAWNALRARTSTRTGLPEYSVSKLCNVLFSAELGRRLAGSGVTTYSLHPGVVATDIWRGVPWPLRPLIKLAMISPERGTATTLHCATSPALADETGRYYDNCRPKQPSTLAQDSALAAELWKRSQGWMS